MREQQRRLTIDRVVSSARHVFFEDGYALATMEEVAREAGISRTTLYQYFPSKSAIMDAILDVEIPRYVQMIKALPGGLDDRHGVEILLEQIRAHYRENARFVAILQQALPSDDAVARRIESSFDTAIDLLVERIPRGWAGQRSDDDRIRSRIQICLSTTDTMFTRCLRPESAEKQTVILEELVTMWSRMLENRQSYAETT